MANKCNWFNKLIQRCSGDGITYDINDNNEYVVKMYIESMDGEQTACIDIHDNVTNSVVRLRIEGYNDKCHVMKMDSDDKEQYIGCYKLGQKKPDVNIPNITSIPNIMTDCNDIQVVPYLEKDGLATEISRYGKFTLSICWKSITAEGTNQIMVLCRMQ